MATPDRYTIWTLLFLIIVLVMFASVWTGEAGWRSHMVTAFIAAVLLRIFDWCLAQFRGRTA